MNQRTLNKENSLQSVWVIFLIYLTIFINSYVFFTEPFEFYFGYLIYVVLLPVFIYRYGFNSNLLGIFLVLFFTGLFNIFLGNNTPALFFKVFTGLMLSYFFYHYVIEEFDFNIERLFKWYLKGAYWVSIIGLIQFISFQINFEPGYNFHWIFNKWGLTTGGLFGIRLNSVFPEPTHFATSTSAAFFVSLYNLGRRNSYGLTRLQSVVIIVTNLLSFSGIGQTGIFFCFLFLAISFGLVRYFLIIIPLVLVVFILLYNNVKEFRERYDSLISLFSGEEFKLGVTHGSSFILYNNYVVTKENFKSNFMFGGGVGSHPVAFAKYSLARNFKVYGFNSNAPDANSMLLRLISETGLFGTSIFLFITFKCYVRRKDDEDSYHWLISNALIVMILLNLIRQGHYFLLGFPFFFLLYYYNYISYRYYLAGDHKPQKIEASDTNEF